MRLCISVKPALIHCFSLLFKVVMVAPLDLAIFNCDQDCHRRATTIEAYTDIKEGKMALLHL